MTLICSFAYNVKVQTGNSKEQEQCQRIYFPAIHNLIMDGQANNFIYFAYIKFALKHMKKVSTLWA